MNKGTDVYAFYWRSSVMFLGCSILSESYSDILELFMCWSIRSCTKSIFYTARSIFTILLFIVHSRGRYRCCISLQNCGYLKHLFLSTRLCRNYAKTAARGFGIIIFFICNDSCAYNALVDNDLYVFPDRVCLPLQSEEQSPTFVHMQQFLGVSITTKANEVGFFRAFVHIYFSSDHSSLCMRSFKEDLCLIFYKWCKIFQNLGCRHVTDLLTVSHCWIEALVFLETTWDFLEICLRQLP